MATKDDKDNLVDMKLTPAQRNGMNTIAGSGPMRDEYSYGLQIRLEKADLEKLGIKKLPDVGEYFHLEAACCVKRVYSSEGMGEQPDQAVTLQIEKMKVTRE